jgi:2-dehydropantoate 2-reductase
MLKDMLAGATLELDAIAGPIMRASPDGAPVTRSVVAEITHARREARFRIRDKAGGGGS